MHTKFTHIHYHRNIYHIIRLIFFERLHFINIVYLTRNIFKTVPYSRLHTSKNPVIFQHITSTCLKKPVFGFLGTSQQGHSLKVSKIAVFEWRQPVIELEQPWRSGRYLK